MPEHCHIQKNYFYFQHGNVGYVPSFEMPLFVGAFKKSKGLSWDDSAVLETLQHGIARPRAQCGVLLLQRGDVLVRPLQVLPREREHLGPRDLRRQVHTAIAGTMTGETASST